MSSLTTASEADLIRLAAMVTAKREDLPAQGLPLSLLRDLMDQIRCDAITFCGRDSGRQEHWFGQDLYTEMSRQRGIRRILQLCLPGPSRGPGRTIRLMFLRMSGPDFTEGDRALLTLMRPHLHRAYLDAERRRVGARP
jgi:hypothetical protein